MDFNLFLTPSEISDSATSGEDTIGQSIQKDLTDIDEASFAGYKIALIGVCESRNAVANAGTELAPDQIRKYLYALKHNWPTLSIIDLGNILPGKRSEDTLHALTEVVHGCCKSGVIPVVIGGSSDLCFAMYRGYEKLEQVINLVSIDNQFDLGDVEAPLTAKSYLNKIILHQPNFLFNYSCLGYQTYFVTQSERDLMERLFFDVHRLGEVQADLREVEPVVRNADMVSFDISAIRQSDAPGNRNATPNGFYGEEACAIARYAGLSEKLTSFGLFEVNPLADNNGQTSHLAAQMIWYFIEGCASRKHDGFFRESRDLLKYTVTTDAEIEEIVFYKHLRSDRWWMDVPYPDSALSRFRRHQLVPCSYKDYKSACNNEIPEKWWKNFQKLQ
jgi:arginase family enzyme